MSIKNLGIIGGGQLGSLLAVAAKKLNINTTIYCDDVDAPAQNFCDKFIHGRYDDKIKMHFDFVIVSAMNKFVTKILCWSINIITIDCCIDIQLFSRDS